MDCVLRMIIQLIVFGKHKLLHLIKSQENPQIENNYEHSATWMILWLRCPSHLRPVNRPGLFAPSLNKTCD